MLRHSAIVFFFVAAAAGDLLAPGKAHATQTVKITDPTSQSPPMAEGSNQAFIVNVAQISGTAGTVKITFTQGNLNVGSFSANFAQGATTVTVNCVIPNLPNGDQQGNQTATAQGYNNLGNQYGESDYVTITVIDNP